MTSKQPIRDMLTAAIFFALMEVCVKFLRAIPAVEIAFFRSLFSLGLGFMHIRISGIGFATNNRKLLIWRGLAGTFGLLLFFSALQRIPLATAVSIQHLSALFTVLMAGFMVGEVASIKEWLFLLLGFVGVVLIKGFDPSISTIDLVIALSAPMFSAVSYNLIRLMNNREQPLLIVFYFTVTAVFILGPITAIYWVPPSPVEWVWLCLVGICTQLAQVYMTKAYQAEKATIVSAISYVGIIFAYGFGYFLFGERLHIMATLGIGLIILSVLLMPKPKPQVKKPK